MATAQDPWLTVREIRERIDLDGVVSDSSTGRLQQAAAAACSWIDTFLERRLLESSYRRRFDTSGETFIALPFPPVVDVLSVEVDGTSALIGSADNAYTNPAVIWYDEERIYRMAPFPRRRISTLVEWVGGYQSHLIPMDIRSAGQTLAVIFAKEARRAGDESGSRGRSGSVKYLRELTGAEQQALMREKDSRSAALHMGYPLPGDEGGSLGVFQLGASELGPP